MLLLPDRPVRAFHSAGAFRDVRESGLIKRKGGKEHRDDRVHFVVGTYTEPQDGDTTESATPDNSPIYMSRSRAVNQAPNGEGKKQPERR